MTQEAGSTDARAATVLASAVHRTHEARRQAHKDAATPCEETDGLFPCSSSLSGSIFLTATYGFLLLKGANLISDGSELLLEVFDPGLIGGLLLPILGALPDTAVLYVGHDYSWRTVTTVGEEKKLNPRLSKSRAEFVDLMEKMWDGTKYPRKIDASLPANMVCGVFESGGWDPAGKPIAHPSGWVWDPKRAKEDPTKKAKKAATAAAAAAATAASSS